MNANAHAGETIIHDRTANPAPLGLMGFGMTTVLLSLSNAGQIPMTAAIVAMGLLVGGLAQLIAGLMEWKKGNTFGMTVFSLFGFFWITLMVSILVPKLGLAAAADGATMGWLMFIWGMFAAYLTIGTIGTNRVTQLTFATLTIVLFSLAIADGFAVPELKTFAGYVGILAGASAVYSAMALVLNEALGKSVVPVFPVRKHGPAPKEGDLKGEEMLN